MGKIGPTLKARIDKAIQHPIDFSTVDINALAKAILERASGDTVLLAKRGIPGGATDRTGSTVNLTEIEQFFHSEWGQLVSDIASE